MLPHESATWVGTGKSLSRVRRQIVGIAAVLAIHAALFVALSRLTPIRNSDGEERDITVSLIKTAPVSLPEPKPELQSPSVDAVSTPDIEIADAAPTEPVAAISAIPPWEIQPARPDPNRLNEIPRLPSTFRQAGTQVSALVRIFVTRNGSISDAQIARSTGKPELDAMLLAYVKEHWHFLPASHSGAPLEEWTTVLVPLREA